MGEYLHVQVRHDVDVGKVISNFSAREDLSVYAWRIFGSELQSRSDPCSTLTPTSPTPRIATFRPGSQQRWVLGGNESEDFTFY